MKTAISALMDGEAEQPGVAAPLEALSTEGEARDTWRRYHLIGDAMRDTRMLSAGFAGRVAARLAQEPTVLAPSRIARVSQQPRWQLLSAAASLAAVALVGWLAFGIQADVPQLAQAPRPAAATKAQSAQLVPPVAQVLPAAAQVRPPDSADDYLYAHQGYSPRSSLRGVAPYVRMVSGEAGARNR